MITTRSIFTTYYKTFLFVIELIMAHKKAQSSTQNFRDSKPKYRGVKLFGGQIATAWNIILRQQGNKYEAGTNTYLSKDFSIHASVDGSVHFTKKRVKKFDGRSFIKTFVEIMPHASV